MFPKLPITNSNISLLRILNSLSKTLGIAKQFIPIYKDFKPIITRVTHFIGNINIPNNYLIQQNKNQTKIIDNSTNKSITFFK